MDDYRKELAEIEGLLSESRYEECSMKCGKRIELALKHLAKVYIEKTSEARGRSLREKMRQGQPLERQSLGALAKLYKDEGILGTLVDRQNPSHRELRALDLDMIAHIRNKAAHDRQDDVDLEKSDALLLYGSLLKLLAITGLLRVEKRDKAPVVSTREDHATGELVQHNPEKTAEPPVREGNGPKVIMTPIKHGEKKPPSAPQIDAGEKGQAPDTSRTVILYRNKTSGKYFVYEKQLDRNTLYLITPNGELKPLKEDLFEEYGEVPEAEAVGKGLITTNQVAKHRSNEEVSKNTEQHETRFLSSPEGVTKVSRPQKPRNVPAQPYYGKKVSQDELIPHIVRVLQKHGGRARKDEVEQEIHHMFKDVFKEAWYLENLSNGVPRWQKNIAFAKERAKKKELIKPPGDSGRGCWELTDKGRKY